VRGKDFVRPDRGGVPSRPVNEEFLKTIREKEKAPIQKFDLPQTSAQEIGWFAKPEPGSQKKYHPTVVPDFRKVSEVNHPKVDSDILQFKDHFWRFNPPPPARFHPKSQ